MNAVSPWAKLVLALVLLSTAFLMVPSPAFAVCCGYATQDDYYSDPGLTQYCGTCWEDCGGNIWCTGQTCQYSKQIRYCCPC